METPKAILDQLEISDKLTLEVNNKQIVLTPIKATPRLGWSAAFQQMAENGDDRLLVAEGVDSSDFEWEW